MINNLSKDIKFKYIINNQYIRRSIFKHVHIIHSLIKPYSIKYKWQELLEDEFQLAFNSYTNEFIHMREKEKEYNNSKIKKKKCNVSKFLYVLPNVAASKGNIELLEYLFENGEFFNGLELAVAITNQQFHLVDFLLDRFGKKQNLHEALKACAEYGNLETMQKINEHCSEHYNWGSITDLAFKNSFDMGKWLFETRKHKCTASTTSKLIELKDITIIQWLIDNDFPFNVDAMSIASGIDDYDIFMLLKRRSQHWFFAGSLLKAAKHDNVWLIRHIKSQKLDRFTTNVVAYIAGNGNLSLLEEIGGPKLQYCGKLALSRAAANNHFHIVKLLLEIDHRITCIPKYLLEVAMNGHIEMLKLLFNYQPDTFTSDIVDHVASNGGSIPVLNYLIFDLLLDPSPIGFGQTAANGHLEQLKFLLDSSTTPMYCPNDQLDILVYTDHYHVLRWLLKKDLFLKNEYGLFEVFISHQCLDMINLLMNRKEKFEINRVKSILQLLQLHRFNVIDLLLESYVDDFVLTINAHLIYLSDVLPNLSVRSFKYFISKFGELELRPIDIHKMISSDNLNLLHYCLENVTINPQADFSSIILARNTLPFVRYYLEYLEGNLTKGFEETIAERGDVILMTYLHYRFKVISSPDKAMESAINRNHGEVVRFLYENTTARPSLSNFAKVRFNHFLVRYFYYQGKDSITENIDKTLGDYHMILQEDHIKSTIQRQLENKVIHNFYI